MAETKPVKDSYPYEQTWKSLTKKQQKEATRRANRSKLTIPVILKNHYVGK
ncbi:hypothetical protein KSC_033350 [Ktedonobacter sp. SOSP1-52]|uniref:hypothetical protein n=1 Tax=Ktedonobacter sp. SOSP1-52 TaxID=2778366 RepID=UPI001914E68C|nr:hypothetical protein [Ktedonobacter sp. SOSP1-52]GHO64443.1 hypothetical protein KSC_033350 [Ktedonobacter sp. SOSP1-52]